ILTGDFLFARASWLSARIGAEAVRSHSETFERLCLGQLHETVGPKPGDDPFAHYISVLSDKTASLLALAGGLGASLSGAPERTADVMRRYGEKVGVAFQLADDVLDLESDAATSGKTPGIDLPEGVPTMPTLLVRRRAAPHPAAPTRQIIERLDATSGKTPGIDLREGVPTMPTLLVRRRAAEHPDARSLEIIERLDGDLSSEAALAELVTMLRADPALEQTRELAARTADEAIEILAELPEGHVRDALTGFTTTLVRRSS